MIIEGSQYPDGSITREILVNADVELDSQQARQLAAALTAAADELDRLAQEGQPQRL